MAEISDLSGTDASNTGRFPENQAPSTVNNGARALEGMLGRAFKDIIDGAITTGGTDTAYTVTTNRTISAYYDGLTIAVEWNATCGATPTVNVNSIGAKAIYWPDGTQATTGDLVSGGRGLIQYDGTNFQVLATRPISALVASDIGSTVQGYDADTLKADTSARITANMGFTPASDTSSSGSVTFDFSTGNICKITLTEAITSVTIAGADAGDTLKIWITQAAGGYAVSGWASTVKWAGGGTAPTISTTSGAVDIITLEYDGTNYYAAISQDYQ
jgi:hypothetical protein